MRTNGHGGGSMVWFVALPVAWVVFDALVVVALVRRAAATRGAGRALARSSTVGMPGAEGVVVRGVFR